jgi:uncharacterized protein
LFCRLARTNFLYGSAGNALIYSETSYGRAPDFGHGQALPRWWHSGNPYRTAVYNAFSATFPKGEAFFIQSARHFRDSVSPRLAAEIEGFTAQEAAHSREHLAFNRRANEAGFDLTLLERAVEQRLVLARQRPPVIALAVTMALEHFTAILAHQVLSHPESFADVDPDTAALWLWHSAEEIEHKGVAFDIWREATRHWPRLRKWLVRVRVMLHVTRVFLHDRTFGAIELLRQDGITGVRAWLPLLWEMWGRPGMFRKALVPWLRYFLPGFHPWNHDDRQLIESFTQKQFARANEPSLNRAACNATQGADATTTGSR